MAGLATGVVGEEAISMLVVGAGDGVPVTWCGCCGKVG